MLREKSFSFLSFFNLLAQNWHLNLVAKKCPWQRQIGLNLGQIGTNKKSLQYFEWGFCPDTVYNLRRKLNNHRRAIDTLV